jgi:hypothetical protein
MRFVLSMVTLLAASTTQPVSQFSLPDVPYAGVGLALSREGGMMVGCRPLAPAEVVKKITEGLPHDFTGFFTTGSQTADLIGFTDTDGVVSAVGVYMHDMGDEHKFTAMIDHFKTRLQGQPVIISAELNHKTGEGFISVKYDPTELYLITHRKTAPEFFIAIRNHSLLIGMTEDEARAAMMIYDSYLERQDGDTKILGWNEQIRLAAGAAGHYQISTRMHRVASGIFVGGKLTVIDR